MCIPKNTNTKNFCFSKIFDLRLEKLCTDLTNQISSLSDNALQTVQWQSCLTSTRKWTTIGRSPSHGIGIFRLTYDMKIAGSRGSLSVVPRARLRFWEKDWIGENFLPRYCLKVSLGLFLLNPFLHSYDWNRIWRGI